MQSDRGIRLGRVQPVRYKAGLSAFWLCLLAGDVPIASLLRHPGNVAGTIMVALIVIGCAYMAILGLAFTWRDAAWLHGTVLTVRGAFLTRSADLATATVHGEVWIGHKRDSRVSLIATDPATNRAVNLRLGSVDSLDLSAADLIALADALESRRADTATNAEALRLAARLRQYCRFLPYSRAEYMWSDPPAQRDAGRR